MQPRIAAIDWVKGLAIIGVLLIHARPLAGTAVHEHLVGRSVFVLIVLFGITSELWWQRADTTTWGATALRWYRSRFTRLLPPVWGALAVLWTVRFATDRDMTSAANVALSFVGYMPWVGTGWFVTLALELVLLFPILRVVVSWLGDAASLLMTACILVVSDWYMYDVIALMRWILQDRSLTHVGLSLYYYYWIFPLPWLFSIVCGMLIARHGPEVGPRAAAGAAVVVTAGAVIVDTHTSSSFLYLLLMVFLDVPLTLAVLGAVRMFALLPRAASVLAWYGRHSWGIYLGQLIVHESVHAFTPASQGSLAVRWAYFLALLASATVLVPIGERARRGLTSLLAPLR